MNLTSSVLERSALSNLLRSVAPTQLVFIDRNVPDYHALAAGVLPGIATVLVDLDSNGIDQITEALARHRGLTAIHIVSHGTSGSMQLGNGYLELDNLAEYTDRLRSWSQSLAADAEILLYGCEVAQGSRGAALVAWLAELTQARVIAKGTKTGNAALGGDWDLAALVPLAFTAEVMADYQGVLANIPGTSGNDDLAGTADDDTITPLTGVDTVDGGAGTDTLVVDYSGAHTSGITYVNAYNAATGVGTLRAGTNPPGTILTVDQIAYTNIEKFNITGTANNDDIRGGTGNDILNGGGGNDVINAGGGVDTIDGGAGIDDGVTADISDTATANTIDLGNSANTLANGTQLLNIERFSDLKTGAGDDQITTTGDNDDTINSGAGNDTIDAKNGNNSIDAGVGNDNVTTGSGNDNILGGDGNDTISSGAGDDTINGGVGDDIIDAGTGVNTVDGGTGTDTLVVDYSGAHTSGITYVNAYNAATGVGTLRAGTNPPGTILTVDQVAYSNIDKLNITGTSLADDIRGGFGNDILNAGTGDDTLTDGGGGVDIIDGGVGIDEITIDLSTTTANNTIDLNNASNTLANGTELRNIERFKTLTTGAGNDRIIAKDGNYNDIIISGSGNDTIDAKDGVNNVTSGDGNDTITTGTDDDTINAGTGVNTVDGGAGTDTLVVDYSGAHTSGITYVNAYNAATGVGTLRAGTNPPGTILTVDQVAYTNIEKFNITGTANADDIRGGNNNDILNGGGGNDVINGGSGVDIIDGGTGIDGVTADISTTATANTVDLGNATNTLANGTQLLNIERFSDLKTGAGDDQITTTGDNDDTINSGAGNDMIDAKGGNNTIDAGVGNDNVTTGSGTDNILGGDGNDTISSGAGDDTINGGNNDDIIDAGTGVNTVDGGTGTDTLVVDYSGAHTSGITYVNAYNAATGVGTLRAGTNPPGTILTVDQVAYTNIDKLNITGTANSDDIRGGTGADILNAGGGDDTLTDGGGGVDIIDGGIGIDEITIDLSTTTANNTIDLNNASNTLANGTELRNIERFKTLTTGAGNDMITAAIGNYNDIINSGAGNDIIDAKDGVNRVTGGNGNDTITTGTGDDAINGDNDDDTINAGTGVNIVNGSAGTDTLVVDYSGAHTSGITYVGLYDMATGEGTLRAGTNPPGTILTVDQVTYFNIEKFNITGTANNDDIRGGTGADILKGGKGNDTISSGAGNDLIIGVNSDDATPGNAEIDTLTGGADNDIFVLSANGKDFYTTSGNGDYAKITDFSLTQDVIQLRGAASDYSVTATTVGGSLPAVGGVIPPNTALFRGSELIAVLQGIDSTSVNLTSTAFSYSEFTVLNDLPPVVSISNATPVTEGQSGTSTATFNVKLSNASTKTVTVPYTTADGTATTGDNDYVGATAGSLTFQPGETSKNISVVINGDTKIEPDETFSVTLGAPTNATLATTTMAAGRIVSDDATVTISSTVNTAEGSATPGQFILTRTGGIANDLFVPYTLTGTATNGLSGDYIEQLFYAFFSAGSSTAGITVNPLNDNIFEGATPETVILTLTASNNYSLGTTPTATITIADNDTAPTINLTNGSPTFTEGNSGTTNAAFTIALSNPTSETVTVEYSTADATVAEATDRAIAGSDYTAVTGIATFTPGQVSKVINVPIIGDVISEEDETFKFNLANPTNAPISGNNSTNSSFFARIVNDDLPTISVTVTDANAAETATGQPANIGEFTFTRAGSRNLEKTFLYTLSGTAANGSDYTIPRSVTFDAGSSTAKVAIDPTDDNIFEGATPETVVLTLVGDGYTAPTNFGVASDNRPSTYLVDRTNNTGTISIADNDSRPNISIADSTPRAEGNTGNSNTPFTVTLSNPTTESVTVDYATADGTATAGTDYTASTGTVTFTPLSTTRTINVPIIGDLLGEPDETFAVNLTNAQNATGIVKATGTGTISNEDALVTVVATTNGAEGTAPGQFTLTRAGATTAAVTVNYTLSGTATNGADYTIPGNATFAVGSSTTVVNLSVIDDNIFEGATPETVVLTLTAGTNYGISATPTATINISDNDSRPTISINAGVTFAIAEGNTGTTNAGFTVSLSNASTETITVDLSTADGTATAGSDYQALTNQKVSFTPGQTSQIVNVAVNGDFTFEANETFSAVLSNASNGTISSTAGTGIGTINNDDLQTISVAVTDAEAAETLTGQPANPGEFTFTRVGGEATEKTVLYNLSGTATNGSDYIIPGSVTFAAGSTTAKVVLSPTDDNLFEGATPETAILTLKDDAYSYTPLQYIGLIGREVYVPATYRVDPTNNSGTISIADNDSRPNISIADTSVTEGNTGTNNAAFTVTLSNPSTETVTVKYTAGNGTADGNDYTATNGTVTFTPGQISQIVTVPIVGDLSIEGDETFTVTLSDAVSATGITRATATGTILDNDNGINVGVANPNITEGVNGVYTLTRTGDLTAAISVAYTLSGTATTGSDYQAVAGTATFAAGAGTTLVNLATIDDTIFEGVTPESVILTLTPSTNYLLGNSNASTINIADNDSRPVISISNTAIAEGNTGTSKAGFTVSLSNASTEAVAVNLSTADGTATIANSDYQSITNQTVTFTPGQTSQVVDVDISGDLTFEANETFGAVLSGANNGTISSTAGTGTSTINNDDLPTISVAVTDAEASETLTGQPANTGEFTLTRSGVTADPLTVIYNFSGVAVNGGDYSIPRAVVFGAGSSTATVILTPADDNIFEGIAPETANLTIVDKSFTNNSIYPGLIFFNDTYVSVGDYLIDAASNTSTINIADNDARPTLTIGNVSQAEGNSGTSNFGFNLALSNPTVETVAVDYSTADGTATVVGTTSLDPDYTAKSGTVIFTPLQTSQTINVAVNGDKDFEADKTFTVNLANAKNTSGINTATGTGTIVNDDTLPSVTVAATNPISTEGTGEGLFTFYRSGGNLDRALTVNFDLGGNASTRQGYGTQSGSVIFIAGSNTATLAVPVANNGIFNAYRSCIVTLRSGIGYGIGSGGFGGGGSGGSGGGGGAGSGGSGGGAGGGGGSGGDGGFGSGAATVNIVDNDTAPVISINDVSINESNSGTKDLTFTVTLSNASDDVVKVDYASADATAKAVSDYLATTGTLNFTPSDIIAGTTEFTPGETSKTITVKINGDIEIETNEAFILNLSNAVGGTLGKATGTGTIINDDNPAEIGEKADILWRNDDGYVALWQMDGATVTNAAFTLIQSVDPSWKVTGTGDFNGDKKSDILWRNDDGAVSIWQMDGSKVVSSSLASIALLDNSWKAAGTGDFDGDGKSDILWRNDDGAVAIWQMDGSTVTSSTLTSTPILDKSWKAAGTGDFNGDGKSDILWRNDDGSTALWQMNGNNVVSSSLTSTPSLDGSWKINGTGDFNGDGKSDILWSNKNIGEVAIWQMNGAQVVDSSRTSTLLPDPSWTLSGVGDFNGDKKSDVLWYNANNNVAIWEMNGAQVVSSTLTSTPSSHSNWKVAGIVI